MESIIEISTWLSAERQWSKCIEWMHQNGRKISLSTLRRAIDENGRTARQRLALELLRKYYDQFSRLDMIIDRPTPDTRPVATA